MLKYVLLKLLANEPRHGYDLMRLFGERGWGSLAAGTLYPTLAKLEEMGYLEGHDEGGRRTYRITEAGRQRLREIADDLESEFEAHESQAEPQSELREALSRLTSAVSQGAGSARPETAAKIVERLNAARKEIYTLLANE
ncbi:MAG TPA: PadR family transcriptional regulator [Candidatus Baltobacteraceae bacterium]|nr:PadR family transcriptional regulator [Candidatus Baltobacteraceae bacterium]